MDEKIIDYFVFKHLWCMDYDFDRENVEVFIEKIIEKAMKICEARNE